MKKLLLDLVKFPEYGGISTVTSILLPKLIEHGFDVSIISHRLPNKEYDGPDQVKLYYTPDTDNLNDKRNWDFYKQLLSINKFNVIIYQDSYAPIERMVCSIGKQIGAKLYIFEHNAPCLVRNSKTLKPWYTIKGSIRRLFNNYFERKEINRKKYLYNNCDKYILLCNSYIKEFQSYTKIKDSSKLFAINNPIEISLLTDRIQKLDKILFVGRLMPEKGVDYMINLMSHSKLSDFDLSIVGDGPMYRKYEQKILSDQILNVHLEGFKDPTEYYKTSKVFWMYSKYEGWPMTLIEAMSYGCVPVVLNTFSAVYDIIDDNINGFIIDSTEKERFISLTNELLSDHELFSKMSRNAIEKARKFTIETIFKQWLTLLNSDI